LKWEDYEEYKGLKIQERKIKVTDFLIWKSKEILKKAGISFTDKGFAPLRKMILNLKNKDEIKYKSYKEILEKVVSEIKLRRKIFTLIKKYQGQYDNNLRTVVCLNDYRVRIWLRWSLSQIRPPSSDRLGSYNWRTTALAMIA
jgi:hypothetical protein